MVEALHAFAVAPAALGTCCVAADRGRPRAADLAASAVMTIAMLDAAVVGLVPTVWWTALLLVAALAHAAWTRARRSARGAASAAMIAHGGVGLAVMAALLLLMTASPTAAVSGHHGSGSGSGPGVILVLVVGYAGASAWLARRGTPLTRLQLLMMGASTVLMGLAALL
jgi:hypothetical protein